MQIMKELPQESMVICCFSLKKSTGSKFHSLIFEFVEQNREVPSCMHCSAWRSSWWYGGAIISEEPTECKVIPGIVNGKNIATLWSDVTVGKSGA